MEFQILDLILSFPVIDAFKWFCMVSLHKLSSSLFLDYIHVNDVVMMLSATLLSMLMIILSTLSMIRYRINKSNGLLVSMLENLNLFCFTGLLILVPMMWKWVGLYLRKNHFLKCWGCLPLLNWIRAIGTLTKSLLL